MTKTRETHNRSNKKSPPNLPFRRHGERSLEGRLLGLGNLWGITLVVIASAFIWIFTGLLLQNSMGLQATQWLDKMDELGTPLLVTQKPEEFAAIEAHALKFPEIAYLRYYADDGKTVIGEYFSTAVKPRVAPLTPEATQRMRQKSDAEVKSIHLPTHDRFHLRIGAPAVIKAHRSDGMLDFSLEQESQEKTQVIGFVDLMLDFSHYREFIKKSLGFALLAIIALFALTTLFGRVVLRKALRPLEDLQLPLEKLSRGETDINVTSSGPREIAAIGHALNTTVRAIKERDARLQKMANLDALTGLYNRLCFNQLLDSERNRLEHSKQTSALFFIDLDQFKYLNDTAGHAAGDRLLVEIGALLKKTARQEDVVARFGGDEFLILLKNVSLKSATEIADQLLKAFQNYTFVEDNKVFHIYCSIGIAMMTQDGASTEELISYADIACHEAKVRGRNRYELFDAEKTACQQMAEDVGWAERIRNAIDNDDFRLFFQMAISLVDHKVRHYEVLLRMFDAQHEAIRPSAFMPAAERFGLSVEIDRHVVKKVITLLADNSDTTTPIFSINLSTKTVQTPAFIDEIKLFAEQANVAPQSLWFEISAQMFVNDSENVRVFVEAAEAHGFGIVLDDFGSTLGALNALKTFTVNMIKLDGILTRQLDSDLIDQAMINSTVQMAKALGVKTAAKMVADEETLLLLKGFGVDFAQGRYIGKPTEDFSNDAGEKPALSVV